MNKERLIYPSYLKQVLQRHQFMFKKQLGQNFLIDLHILDQIISAANLSLVDGVLEVGPGMGTLTEELADYAGQVVAVEKDSRLIPILSETLAPYSNVHIEHADILEIDLSNVFASWF